MTLTYEIRSLAPHSTPVSVLGLVPPHPDHLLDIPSVCACSRVCGNIVCRSRRLNGRWGGYRGLLLIPYMCRQVFPLNSEFANLLLWVVSLLERSPVSVC